MSTSTQQIALKLVLTSSATSSHPVWQLTPLPLSQLDPDDDASRRRRAALRKHGKERSLQSSCLSSISRSFHLYTPASLQTLPTLPTHLIRMIMQYVRDDRDYQDHYNDGDNTGLNDTDIDREVRSDPDETTIWAYSAILDPSSSTSNNGPAAVDKDHSLGLPTSELLRHVAPDPTRPRPVHPFIAIPALYRQINPDISYRFLTTLVLDGNAASGVDDHSIVNLRWCTDLTALWVNNCKVSDVGVRLLATALELPGPGRSASHGGGTGAEEEEVEGQGPRAGSTTQSA